MACFKAYFPLGDFVRATRSENKNDWLKWAGEKIRRKQVGTVPTFSCSREQIRQVENRLKSSVFSSSISEIFIRLDDYLCAVW